MESEDILFRKRENILISALINPYGPQFAFKECLERNLLIRLDEPSEEENNDKYYYNYLEIKDFIEPYTNYYIQGYTSGKGLFFNPMEKTSIPNPEFNSIYNGTRFHDKVYQSINNTINNKIGEVNLNNSAFINCWFNETDLTDSNFNNTIFMTKYMHDKIKENEITSMIGKDYNSIVTKLKLVTLVNVQMMNSKLYDITITRCNLTSINLTGSDLTNAKLYYCDLTNAILINVNLTGAILTGSNLTGSNLTGADLTGADLTGADLTGADLTGAITNNVIRHIEPLRHMIQRRRREDPTFLNPEENAFLNQQELLGGKKCKTKKFKKTKKCKTKKCKTKKCKTKKTKK